MAVLLIFLFIWWLSLEFYFGYTFAKFTESEDKE